MIYGGCLEIKHVLEMDHVDFSKTLILFLCAFTVFTYLNVHLPKTLLAESNANSLANIYRNLGHGENSSQERGSDQGNYCKAMFTVTDAFDERIPSKDSSEYIEASIYENIARQLHMIRRKRENGTGPSTRDYREISRLLPNLLYFKQSPENGTLSDGVTNPSQASLDQTKTLVSPLRLIKQEDSPILNINSRENEGTSTDNNMVSLAGKENVIVKSRFQSTGGILPFLPCRIHAHSERSLASCFRKRQADTAKMTIMFMGDSKIRNVWRAFLDESSSLQYILKYGNTSVPWLTGRKKTNRAKIDFDAVSTVFPKLEVLMRFRTFYHFTRIEWTEEVKQLKEWAEGIKPVPDLLVVGYSAWIMCLQFNYKEYVMANMPLDVVNLFYNVHKIIVPLLKAVSRKTKILFHADTRLKPYARSINQAQVLMTNGIFHDSLVDWGELLFWHFLQDNEHPSKQQSYTSLLMSVFMKPSIQPFRPSQYDMHSMKQLPTAYQKNAKKPLLRDSEFKESVGHSQRDTRDYLKEFGLWWWDTSLVLNLATIMECNELHRLNLTGYPFYNGTELNCLDVIHSGSTTLSCFEPLPLARATRFEGRQHQYAFCIPRCRTSQFQRSFLPNTVIQWNDLPPEIMYEALRIFKRDCNATLRDGATAS